MRGEIRLKKKALLSMVLTIIILSIFTEVLAGSCSDSSHNCGGNGGNHSTGQTCTHGNYGGWECYTCAESTSSGTVGWEGQYCTKSGCGKRKQSTTREHSYGSSCSSCGEVNIQCSNCGHCKKHTCYTPPAKTDATNPTLTAYSGTYDGNAHTVGVSGGSGGTIQYSTDNSNWGTTKPSRTDTGTTMVYVRIAGDTNHNNTSSISANIEISKIVLPKTFPSWV